MALSKIPSDLLEGAVSFNSAAPADSLVIDANGNVGVGTSSPANPLHVKSSTNTVAQLESTSPSVYLKFADSNTTNGGFIGYAGETMTLWTDNTLSAAIDASGRITTPRQPAFNLGLTTNTYFTTTSGSVIKFVGGSRADEFNTGGHYSTTTGLFTAPVSGKYLFAFSGYHSTSSTDAYFSLKINGVLSTYGAGSQWGSGYNGLNLCSIYNLSAGDTVGIYSGPALYIYGNSRFSGHLVG